MRALLLATFALGLACACAPPKQSTPIPLPEGFPKIEIGSSAEQVAAVRPDAEFDDSSNGYVELGPTTVGSEAIYKVTWGRVAAIELREHVSSESRCDLKWKSFSRANWGPPQDVAIITSRAFSETGGDFWFIQERWEFGNVVTTVLYPSSRNADPRAHGVGCVVTIATPGRAKAAERVFGRLSRDRELVEHHTVLP